MLHLFPSVVVQEMFVVDVSLASWTQGNVIESSQKKKFASETNVSQFSHIRTNNVSTIGCFHFFFAIS